MHVQMIDVDDVRGVGEGLVDIAVFEDTVPDDIRTHRRVKDCLVGGGHLAIDDRLQWLVIHLHKFGAVFGDGSCFGNHCGDGLSLIACAIDGHRVVENLIAGRRTDFEEGIDELGDFRTGQSADDAWQRLSLGDVNAGDLGVREGRAHERQVQHAEQLDVVDKLAFAANQARVFFALDRLAHPVSCWTVRRGCHDLLRRRCRPRLPESQSSPD